MSEREKKLADTIAKAVTQLPEGKREFLLGYAEGVAAMAAQQQEKEPEPETPADK